MQSAHSLALFSRSAQGTRYGRTARSKDAVVLGWPRGLLQPLRNTPFRTSSPVASPKPHLLEQSACGGVTPSLSPFYRQNGARPYLPATSPAVWGGFPCHPLPRASLLPAGGSPPPSLPHVFHRRRRLPPAAPRLRAAPPAAGTAAQAALQRPAPFRPSSGPSRSAAPAGGSWLPPSFPPSLRPSRSITPPAGGRRRRAARGATGKNR